MAMVFTPGLSPGALRGPEVLTVAVAFTVVFAMALRCVTWPRTLPWLLRLP